MTKIFLIAVVTLTFIVTTSHANQNDDILGRCLLDNTTGKDRKDLAKWIFTGMAAHPEIGAIARPDAKDVESTQRTMGILFTRLIADQCATQINVVMKTNGINAVKMAFEHLGKMAMQELMSNQEVNAAMDGFVRYIDKEKLDKVLKSVR
jgi:hypothetical protein